MSVPAAKRERCLTTAPARTTQPAPSTLPSQTIAPGSMTDAGADATAVDHRPGADDHTVVDDEVVVGQQVQDGVLEDLDVVADAHRAVGVADDLDARADDRAFADDDVAGDLGGREQGRRRGDGRHDASVLVQLAHGDRLLGVFDGDRGRRRDRQVAVAQGEEAGEVVGRRRADDAGRATDGDDVARQGHPGRHERALAEEDAVAEPGAGHQDRGVADLAQVADRRADHDAAVAEDGAPPDRRRDRAGADDDRVLEHGRPGADLHRGVVGADDGALGEQRSLTQARRAHDHGRRGDLRRADLGVAQRVGRSGAHRWANDGAPSTVKARSST